MALQVSTILFFCASRISNPPSAHPRKALGRQRIGIQDAGCFNLATNYPAHWVEHSSSQPIILSRPDNLLPEIRGAESKTNLALLCDEHLRRCCSQEEALSANLSADRKFIPPPPHTRTAPVMNGGVFKARTRRSRVQLSKALQETLLNAVAGNIAGAHVDIPLKTLVNPSGTALPQSYREQTPESRGPIRDARPVQARKRPLDTTESDPSPAKRARLTQTDVRQPGVEDEKAEADKVRQRSPHARPQLMRQHAQKPLQQPKPNPPNHPYASFLIDFVDPVHPAPESVNSFVCEWLESISGRKRCRSDSQLHQSEDGPLSTQPRSEPEMGYTQDADGFAVPPTPTSTGSRPYRADADAVSVATSDLTGAASGSGRSGRSLVEDPLYRDMNLAANNVYMRPLYEEFPEDIGNLVNYVRQDRDSPGPSPDEVRQDAELNELWMGTGEPEVEDYFRDRIFPKPGPSDSLKRSDRQPMAKHTVPSTGSRLKVSTPVPDMLFGYNRQQAFPLQQAQLISMGTEMVANNQYQGLLYPFFVVEFKGDGGSMWVATNQCLGGSASCVNVAEQLNRQLRQYESDESTADKQCCIQHRHERLRGATLYLVEAQ